MMEFERFSRRLRLSGKGFSADEALTTLVGELWQHLPGDTFGHIKAVAHFPDGLLYASGTEPHTAVHLRVLGTVEQDVDSLAVDLTGVLGGVAPDQIELALQAATRRLANDGITLTGD